MAVHTYLKAGAVAAAMGLALSGCMSLITGGDLIREGEPMARFTFENRSQGQPIDVVLISTCDASSYGLNRLPLGVEVGPGQSWSWDISAGCYEVMVGNVGDGSTPGKRIRIPANTRFTLYFTGEGPDPYRQEVR
ncbi:hypothetical protein [Brevundimonas sp.]|uniref:hypothetical protein n=1 Tax=Brevundimonas sp. TaxID=1871086 RepID=UPI003AF6A3DE